MIIEGVKEGVEKLEICASSALYKKNHFASVKFNDDLYLSKK